MKQFITTPICPTFSKKAKIKIITTPTTSLCIEDMFFMILKKRLDKYLRKNKDKKKKKKLKSKT